MKPLLLQLQAFGPFARVQAIDFTLLGAKTFFLIHGPTGSGKTSILDGMCFALFGDSSGGEREGRQMRSHHAEPRLATEVSFEFALGAERYRVRRAPEQLRPARRGDGCVKQAQQAELWRLQGEDAAVLASGWNKVTEEVVRLLGFESRQFRQVIMLPQGRFFEFLKSSTQEREKILQVLFGTELYKRIEESLKRAADEVAGQAKEARTRRQALLEQAGAAGEDELAARRAAQQQALAARQQEDEAAAAQAAAAEAALVAARQLAASFDEADAAAQALTALEQQAGHWEQQAAQLAAARRAAALQPAETAWLQAQERLARETARRQQREADLATAQVAATRAGEALARQAQRGPEQQALAARVNALQALRPRVVALERCRGEHAAARDRHAQAVAREEAARAERRQAVAALEQLQQEIQALTAPAAALEGARLRLQQLQERQRQAQALAQLRRQLAQAQDAVRQNEAAVARAQAARAAAAGERRALLQRWMAGQAARIAHALVAGQPCPVCGAHEHPAPAAPGEQDVPDAALQAAEQQESRADQSVQQAMQALAQAQQQLAALGGKVEALHEAAEAVPDAQLQQAAGTVQQGEQAARVLARCQGRMGATQQAAQQALSRLEAEQAAAQQAAGEMERLGGQLAELQEAVDPQLASLPALDAAWAQASAEHAGLQAALRQAEAAEREAQAALLRARTLAEESAAAWPQHEEACRREAEAFERQRAEAGFADLRAWRQARLEPARMEALEAALRRFEQERAAARERTLRARQQVEGRARPELATHAAEHQAAQAARLAASNAVRDAQNALALTQDYLAALDKLGAAFRQLEERYQVLRSVADLATGNNGHRMSFQRYVLATLLEEVLAATTLRLRVMSRGRYEMRRKAEAADARSAGGLDLEVFDHYTGTTRAVATLSGGESFLASLALALGLSDVVQAQAGGTRLDAIFVDEGFGTLDPEALDFAIRTLKDLQQAGRMVGIISHVAELREWIDARLELKATQSGSEARFVT